MKRSFFAVAIVLILLVPVWQDVVLHGSLSYASGGGVQSALTAEERFTIVMNDHDSDLTRFAVGEIRESIRRILKHDPAVVKASGVNEAMLKGNIIVVGVSKDNALIQRYVNSHFVLPEQRAEGYSLRIDDNPQQPGKLVVIIAGADENGMLYGAMDFTHYYLRKLEKEHLLVNVQDAPRFKKRGLWTWAGRIYNYEAYLDNMARWKMNTLVVWHRFPPANGRALIDYARSRGIQMVWGYTWGWGMPVCPSNPVERKQWQDFVLNTFEKYYAPIGAQGIYFQTFTETSDKNRYCRFGADCPNGCREKTGGQLFVDWVNPMIEAVLAKHPDLWIACGVHASALHESLKDVAKIDKRANLMWEDVGAFPFAYSPTQVEAKTFQETTKFAYELATLRGADEDVAFVFKGMSASWGGFDAMLQDSITLEKLAEQRVPLWKEVEKGWRENLAYELQVARLVCDLPIKQKSILGLVEDGLWESRQWFAVAAFAESIWNPHTSSEDIIKRLDDCEEATKLE